MLCACPQTGKVQMFEPVTTHTLRIALVPAVFHGIYMCTQSHSKLPKSALHNAAEWGAEQRQGRW